MTFIIVRISPNLVKADANPDSDCSKGLHVGNKSFLSRGYFGSAGIVVLVNPKDVVSVPSDYDCQKLRCCAYTVVSEVECEILASATDDNGEALESQSFQEDVGNRNKVIDRVRKYLNRKLDDGIEDVAFRSIQSCFSPDCPSMAEIADAVNALDFTWYSHAGNKFVNLR